MGESILHKNILNENCAKYKFPHDIS